MNPLTKTTMIIWVSQLRWHAKKQQDKKPQLDWLGLSYRKTILKIAITLHNFSGNSASDAI